MAFSLLNLNNAVNSGARVYCDWAWAESQQEDYWSSGMCSNINADPFSLTIVVACDKCITTTTLSSRKESVGTSAGGKSNTLDEILMDVQVRWVNPPGSCAPQNLFLRWTLTWRSTDDELFFLHRTFNTPSFQNNGIWQCERLARGIADPNLLI